MGKDDQRLIGRSLLMSSRRPSSAVPSFGIMMFLFVAMIHLPGALSWIHIRGGTSVYIGGSSAGLRCDIESTRKEEIGVSYESYGSAKIAWPQVLKCGLGACVQ